MRKTLSIAILFLIFGCTKEINSGSVNTDSISDIQNAVATATYLPLTNGSYWTYDIQTDADKSETSKLTVLGIHKKINGKNYKAVKSVRGKRKDTLYYAHDQHDYYLYTYSGTSDADNINMEILFLKDNASLGETWLLPAGKANGFNLKCYGKIVDCNATITVNGVTYNHVIHSYVEIRKPLFFTYIVVNKQNFYTAKNIGIIKNVSDVLLPEKSTTTTKIADYKIK